MEEIKITLSESQLRQIIEESVTKAVEKMNVPICGCIFRDKPLRIIFENENKLVFSFDGEIFEFDKTPVSSLYSGGGVQKGTYLYVSEGKAVVIACEDYDPNDTGYEGDEESFSPGTTITMPRVRDIFSNAEMLKSILDIKLLSMIMTGETVNQYDELLNDLTLDDVIYGFLDTKNSPIQIHKA